jgi:hypothetical protein
MGAMIEENYRGRVIRLTQWGHRWFLSAITDPRDRSQVTDLGSGFWSFAQALAYARRAIDMSADAPPPAA